MQMQNLLETFKPVVNMVTSEYFLGQVCTRKQNHLYSNLVHSYKLLIQGHFTLLGWNKRTLV